MNRTQLALASTLIVVTSTGSTLAAIITPVSAALSGSGTAAVDFGLDDATNLIDGSGLSATPTLANLGTVTHAAFDSPGDNSWAATGSVVLDFDLGGLTPVSSMVLWNFQSDVEADRTDGVNNVSVAFFSDGAGSIIDSIQSVSVPQASALGEAVVVPLTPVASTNYIVLIVNSNHGGNRTGLSEVRFLVPEPASISGVVCLLAYAGNSRRRG